MISKDTYSIEYVNMLREKYRKDPSLLERVLFAFGLLEAITRVGMPFISNNSWQEGVKNLVSMENEILRYELDM